jgi:protein phosphatase 2C family protein 2/3
MFDHADEDKDLDSQVDKFRREGSEKESNGSVRNTREETPGPTSQSATSESPSSVKTEKSEGVDAALDKDTRVPEKLAQQ